ncbi:MAG: peptidoglycan DD-metalloendopeptidase family protein, partial [Candidatus Gracilibacteria bacterium]|nr:peptidoglycan DD-metalloendopeptidase family protein [Candidatus Gracilibacteria bacterium]
MRKVTMPPGYNGEPETSTTITYNDPWEAIETHSVGRSKRTITNARRQTLYVEDSGAGDDGRTITAKIGFAYNTSGKLVKKTDLNAGSMTLDVPENLFTPGVKDTSGNNIACWKYNGFGQVVADSDPDLGHSGITYNAFGEIESRTDGLNRTTHMTYDRLGRLTEKHLSGEEGTVFYRYDTLVGSTYSLGRVVAIDDPAQRKEFSYDPLGRINKEIRVIKDGGDTQYVTSFAYDLLDRKIQILYPKDPKTDIAMTATYRYCPMGVDGLEIQAGEVKKNIIENIAYNEFGQMTEMHRGNNTISYYKYDIKGRLESLLTTAQHNGQTWKVQDVKYQFKIDNSIASVENTPDVDSEGAIESRVRYDYQYDGLNRLVYAKGILEKSRLTSSQNMAGQSALAAVVNNQNSIVKKFELGYTYSANGNLTSKTVYNPDTGHADDMWLYSYTNHAATRVETTKSGLRFEMRYDAAGNMISKMDHENNLAKEIAYDSYNRIKQVTDLNNGNVKGAYWYDDQGFRVRRVAKVDYDGSEREIELLHPSMYFGLEIQRNEAGKVIDDSGFGVNNIYLNGVRVAATLPSGDTRYYLTDQVDSVKAVVDDNGMVVSRMEYLPYGETWFQDGDKKNAPKYNSQELDRETNFYFFNARHYDPEIARFVTPDTATDGVNDTQAWNRYAYCKGNPIMYNDPTGHYVPIIIGAVVGAVMGAIQGIQMADRNHATGGQAAAYIFGNIVIGAGAGALSGVIGAAAIPMAATLSTMVGSLVGSASMCALSLILSNKVTDITMSIGPASVSVTPDKKHKVKFGYIGKTKMFVENLGYALGAVSMGLDFVNIGTGDWKISAEKMEKEFDEVNDYFNSVDKPTTEGKINTEYHDPEILRRYNVEHPGIDVSGSNGTPVYSTHSGEVVYRGFEAGPKYSAGGTPYPGGGNYIITKNIDGTYSAYMHLDKVDVIVGSSLEKGMELGTIGNTGGEALGMGAHLHYEIRMTQWGTGIDPSNVRSL